MVFNLDERKLFYLLCCATLCSRTRDTSVSSYLSYIKDEETVKSTKANKNAIFNLEIKLENSTSVCDTPIRGKKNNPI